MIKVPAPSKNDHGVIINTDSKYLIESFKDLNLDQKPKRKQVDYILKGWDWLLSINHYYNLDSIMLIILYFSEYIKII